MRWLFGFLALWASISTAQVMRDLKVEGDTVAQLPAAAKRWALIVGVDQYSDKQIVPLNGAGNDAELLATELIDHGGFPKDQVIVLTSHAPEERKPNRTNILSRLSLLRQAFQTPDGKDGLLLVFFAGHGIERGGKAYLLPSDARLLDDIELLEATAISLEGLRASVQRMGVKQVLLLLDACRSDPTAGRGEAPNPLTAAYTKAFNFDRRNKEVQAFATIYATAVGKRAYEYSEKSHGYFTYSLVNGLRGEAANSKGEITLGGLVRYLQEDVPRRVRRDLGGDKEQKPFADVQGYLAEQLVLAKVVPAKPVIDPVGFNEVAAWSQIKDSGSVKAFEQFIKDYPSGLFAAQAKTLIERLEWERVKTSGNVAELEAYALKYSGGAFEMQARRQAEETEWAKLGNQPAKDQLQNHLRKYPQGMYAAVAMAKLQALEPKPQDNPEMSAWTKVRDAQDVALFQSFLTQHPNGLFAPQAKAAIERLEWESTKRTPQTAAIERYLAKYPGGAYEIQARNLVEDLDWSALGQAPSKQALELHLKKHPHGPHAAMAMARLRDLEPRTTDNPEVVAWSKVKDTGDLQQLRAFLTRFPNGLFAPQAKTAVERLEWEAVRNAPTLTAIESFLARYPGGAYELQARRAAEELDWTSLGATPAKAGLEHHLKKYPYGVYATTAMARIRELEPRKVEKVVETKLIGSEAGATRRNAKDGLEYKWIPSGSFEMGCVDGDEECEPDEKPRHKVAITNGFWIGKTEVTVAAFKTFVGEGKMPKTTDQNPKWKKTAHPIVNVNWEEAGAFCAWTGGRLPTEAEWEYAGRGGKQGQKYPWGDVVDHDRANYYGKAARDEWEFSATAGTFLQNDFGLFDMAGNVWEWVADAYSPTFYAQSAATDPKAPESGAKRVIRGGSYYSADKHMRVSNRESSEPKHPSNMVGFRCILEK